MKKIYIIFLIIVLKYDIYIFFIENYRNDKKKLDIIFHEILRRIS